LHVFWWGVNVVGIFQVSLTVGRHSLVAAMITVVTMVQFHP